ncbi:hypothetical protein Pmani_001656 [Petrolisthes manimaculis]|uniref:Uncharacterized protein n=1 Tax=Petrolisthes manimaculis TaxID=1843537 RepID=A0AAE1UP88_9EUCA|nr:hypothetical protein Pmani_001656 [Petrolisthes manimaculis]
MEAHNDHAGVWLVQPTAAAITTPQPQQQPVIKPAAPALPLPTPALDAMTLLCQLETLFVKVDLLQSPLTHPTGSQLDSTSTPVTSSTMDATTTTTTTSTILADLCTFKRNVSGHLERNWT